ncbi:MAG: hypothetical protein KDJ75_09840 [Alphaproteobacteria bacterium]|nr:hypothetical protein [Alphaproteobacteria bacterium]
MTEYKTGLYISHPRALSTAFVTALAQPKTDGNQGVLPENWMDDPLQYQNAIVVYHPIRDVIRRRDKTSISVAHQELYNYKHDIFCGAKAGNQYKDKKYGGIATPDTPVVFRESVGPEDETTELQIFPNTDVMKSLPVVVSIRRPKDFITSHLKLWPEDPIDNLEKSYLHLIKTYEAVAEAGGDAMLITADHIRQNPRVTMEKVTDHLGISFHEGMLKWANINNSDVITFENNPFIYLYDESYDDQSVVRVKPWFDSVNNSKGIDARITTIKETVIPEFFNSETKDRIEKLDESYKSCLAIANSDLFVISSP